MALSKQRASTEALWRLVEYAMANGFRVSEYPPIDAANPGVHHRLSFHYDTGTWAGRQFGHAADVNWGAPGASDAERRRLGLLVPVAHSLGVSVLLGLYGTVGSAGAHRGHGHFDVGTWSNLGRGAFVTPKGDVCVARTQQAVNFGAAKRDNLYGPNSDQRVDAVRHSSRLHGERFPWGVAYAQGCVGTKRDNAWGPKSKAAHTETVKELQRAWREFGLYDGAVDGIWGRKMEAAFKALRKNYGRNL